ncbi:helix-turn-helix domain-containing protein [Rhodococcus opacus]|nr:helix-turn-helix domain-containing protein [Rhodococcus opacus]
MHGHSHVGGSWLRQWHLFEDHGFADLVHAGSQHCFSHGGFSPEDDRCDGCGPAPLHVRLSDVTRATGFPSSGQHVIGSGRYAASETLIGRGGYGGPELLPGRSVTSKALTILEAFTGERVELSMSEIARATGLPSSTVHRLIQDLVDWGGLERTSEGKYCVGVRLWEIAARSTRTYGLREAAMPFLQSLWEATRAHILLAVLDGGEALLVEKITGTTDVPPVGRAGAGCRCMPARWARYYWPTPHPTFKSGCSAAR